MRTFGGHGDAVTSVAFSSLDKHVIASAARDCTVRLYHVDTSELLTVMEGHTAPVNSLAFSPDGWLILTAGSDSSLRLWSMAGVRQLLVVHTDDSDEHQQGQPTAVAFHSSQQIFVVGDAEGRCNLWALRGIETQGTTPQGLLPVWLSPHCAFRNDRLTSTRMVLPLLLFFWLHTHTH